MNRKLFLQVTAPALAIGLLLLVACSAGAWYAYRLQKNLEALRFGNIISLQKALELEIAVRQLQFHSFLDVVDPQHESSPKIRKDEEKFKEALDAAAMVATTPQGHEFISKIEAGYQRYRGELEGLRLEVSRGNRIQDLRQFAADHPIRYVIEPCQELLEHSRQRMDQTYAESDRVSTIAHWTMLLLGAGGTAGGLLCGYAIARGLSRSIYQLSVRVHDVAQRLDQDVASVSVAADGDLANLDKQLQEVVHRVEEVAGRVRRHQQDMLRAEQLSAVGQLAASVAHEVRNPLTSVKMLVESALRSRNRKPLTEDDLEVIHSEVTRLEQTVQSFLDFARLPTPRRSASDLREVAAQALDLVRARARQQKVGLTVDYPPHPVSADVDKGQIRTVLVNLFLNSLDAMPLGGKLKIELKEALPDAIRLDVADTGSGIAPEIAERLFTPFTSSKATGTGLGLSISRRIVEEHGGSIAAENRPEGGACFHLVLPVTAADSEEEAQRRRNHVKALGG